MGKRSSSGISKKRTSLEQPGLQVSPSEPAPVVAPNVLMPSRPRRIALRILRVVGPVICVLLIIFGVRVRRDIDPDPSLKEAVDWMAALSLCKEYAALKNAGDPSADQLLATLPAAPPEPISPEQADRFQADCFLYQDIRILFVHLGPPNQFVLVTKGNVSAPTLQVRTAKGVDRTQRTMVNPDLIVEVRDGRIHGVRAKMHGDQ
jgi:hypothetical protein